MIPVILDLSTDLRPDGTWFEALFELLYLPCPNGIGSQCKIWKR